MKFIFRTLIIVAVIWGIFKFIPVETKKAVGEKTGEILSSILPEKVKEKLDPILLSPIERRAEIISQLDKNVAAIEKALNTEGASSSMPAEEREAALKIIGETKDKLAQLSEANKNQGIVNKITSGVFQAVSGALGIAPEAPASSQGTADGVLCPNPK